MKRITETWRRWIKISVGSLCVLALAVWILAPAREQGETVAFYVVDYVTGRPIQDTTVEFPQRWTRWRVESIPLLRIKPWSNRIILSGTGIVQIANAPSFDLSYRIAVGAKGYGEALLKQLPTAECANPDVYRILYFRGGTNWLHESPYEYVNRKRPFTVALEPNAGGGGRAGVRYPAAPSPGSQEKAILTIKRYAEKRGGELGKVESAKFINGHWEVFLSDGGFSTFDVADDGEILGVHPGE